MPECTTTEIVLKQREKGRTVQRRKVTNKQLNQQKLKKKKGNVKYYGVIKKF